MFVLHHNRCTVSLYCILYSADSSLVHWCVEALWRDECDELQGYLGRIRILLLAFRNSFCEEKTMAFPFFSRFIALGGPLWAAEERGEAKRHPLKYFSFDHPIVLQLTREIFGKKIIGNLTYFDDLWLPIFDHDVHLDRLISNFITEYRLVIHEQA